MLKVMSMREPETIAPMLLPEEFPKERCFRPPKGKDIDKRTNEERKYIISHKTMMVVRKVHTQSK